ncbi:MAG: cardiolipin synthase ClsB [Pseudomonadota bacterium]|jgi:cardiolipin synthase
MGKLLAGHDVRLLEGGRQLFPALVTAMNAAQHSIYLETYIFDTTAEGETVAQALMDAARRGVQVRVVMDGVGTRHFDPQWAGRWSEAGVQWRLYKPLGWLGLLIPSRWRRLHRKLCVVDREVAFCGGINILDDWHDPHHGSLEEPRLDFAVEVQGPLVLHVRRAVESLWWRSIAMKELRSRELRAAWRSAQEASARYLDQFRDSSLMSGNKWAALLLRDNVAHRRRIERTYLQAIAAARYEIIIANAYFLPGRKLRQAILRAANRGVKVRLLLQGRYEYFFQYHATRPIYGQLLQAGVEIYEYEPSFLHAKVAVMDARHDHAWATVGSSNLDPLSLLLAREANVLIRDRGFARQLELRLLQVMHSDGRLVSREAVSGRHVWQRALDWVAYALVRTALALTGKRY